MTVAQRAGDERIAVATLEAIGKVQDYAIFMLDAQGRVVTWNEGARLAKGYEASEIVGRSFACFYTDEARAAGEPERLLREAAEHGRVECEGYRVRKDGSRFWADVVITRVGDRPDGGQGFIKVTRDLTERRAREEAIRTSEEGLRRMIESAREYAIFMLDPQGLVSSWNAGAQRIKQYAAEEILGRHFSLFYTEADRALGKPAAMLALALQHGRVEDRGERVRKDGTSFAADVIVTPVHDDDGALLGFTKVTRDLSETVRMERALSVEQERSASARRAVEQRDEFLLVAAHELRTPLTALQLQLEGVERALVKTGASGPDFARVAARMASAVQQGERLGGLIERLLDVSRLVGGRLEMKLEPFDLSELVRAVVNNHLQSALQRGSPLRLSAPAPVVGVWDRMRVEQVIVNLLSNAVKYGSGAPVDVRVEGDGAHARLVVTDQGIGIAAEDLERIFDRFERAASTQHFGGLGLGLYISKRIVDALTGTIEARSELGKGSRFTVTLPTYPRPPARALEQRSA